MEPVRPLSMEEKLNKTIDMLNNMQDYLIENRIIARRTSKLIDGRDIKFPAIMGCLELRKY